MGQVNAVGPTSIEGSCSSSIVCVCYAATSSDAGCEMSELRSRVATLKAASDSYSSQVMSLTDELSSAKEQITSVSEQLNSSRTLGMYVLNVVSE